MTDENGAVISPAQSEGETANPQQETLGNNVLTSGEKQVEEVKPNAETTKEVKTFTQEMVADIVRNRLERERQATFNRYGVKDRDGLDALIGKSQSYDVIKERYDMIKAENATLTEKMAFITNNISPSKEDDVRAYFKGKGIEFNEQNLINELATHPEWLNVKEPSKAPQTTIQTLGVEHKPITHQETESEKMKRIFGV